MNITVYKIQYIYTTRNGNTVSLTKRTNLGCAFEAGKDLILHTIRANDAVWATNNDKLWVIGDFAKAQNPLNITVASVTLEGGLMIQPLNIRIEHQGLLRDISQHLEQSDIRNLSSYLDALNALVTRPIYTQTTRRLESPLNGRLTQVGRYRFFLNEDLSV